MRDVLDSVHRVEEQYESCSTTHSALRRIRQLFREAGSHAEKARPWIKCVPQDIYGSVLNAGFEAIITVSRVPKKVADLTHM